MMSGEADTPHRSAHDEAGAPSAERLDDRVASELAARLESVLARLEALPDQPVRAVALEAVESLVQLYGEGLARIVEQVDRSSDAALARSLARDELVSHLLLLHGLHPDDVDTRVRRALNEVGPYLRSHARVVELVAIEGEVARVRLTASGHGAASTHHALRAAIEDAVLRAAPELSRVDIEDSAEAMPALVPLAGPRRNGARALAANESPVTDRHAARHIAPDGA